MKTQVSLCVCFILICAIFAVAQSGTFEENTDRPGMNLSNFDLSSPDPLLCQNECNDEPECKAWTYVKPGIQGPNARCWLKTGIPDAIPNDCCISGIKQAQPQIMHEMKRVTVQKEAIIHFTGQMTQEENTDRPGMNLDNFNLDTADPQLCAEKCRQNADCKAYTYVKPGIQGPSARCWLKSGTPDAKENNCCTSGIKTGTSAAGILTPTSAIPEIISISPTEPDGAAYVYHGKKITITGKNFSVVKSKNKIGIRTYEDDAQIPPQSNDFIAELTPTSASETQLEAIAPSNVAKNKYLLWVYIEGTGNSKPFPIWIAPVPAPFKPVPVITKIDPTYPGGTTYIYGKNFTQNLYVEWDVPSYFTSNAKYISTTKIQIDTPTNIKAGQYDVRVEASGLKSDWFKATLSEPKPLNLYWNDTDDNGIPLNITWGYQLTRKPTDADYYPDIRKIAPKTSFNHCVGFTCGVERDYSNATDQSIYKDYGMFGCGPHVNWGGVTIEGWLKWSSKSAVGKDDEYNYWFFPDDGRGATLHYGGNKGGIQLEFDSDETIDHFHTSWWDSFHNAVDEGDPYLKAHSMVDNKFAIVSGLWGLDCGHVECQSEIHPVWSIAIQVKKTYDTERWAMFSRNWGNEGYCGTSHHNINYPQQGDKYVYKFKLPWRSGATSVSWTDEFLMKDNISMSITPVTDKGVYVAFYMPHYTQHDRINGHLDLTWSFPQTATYQTQTISQKTNSGETASKQASGMKTSEEEAIFEGIVQLMEPEQRQAFRQEALSIMEKGPVILDQKKPLLKQQAVSGLIQAIQVKMPPVTAEPDPKWINRKKLMQNAIKNRGISLSGMQEVTDEPMVEQAEPVEQMEPSGEPQAEDELTSEYDMNRPGKDYRDFDIPSADPFLCKQECFADTKCKAYTYVKPGVQNENARCWLKYGIPEAIPSDCCISGVKK
ncbi:MAG: hypothetical protein A2Y62_12455 [Candidatus Fischerbacteria bacterium RBG_13_37_8]|uniref:Apple domain-containing protein n=1 Tax=Candidatus Fischerbacteria bacterium RBG_13_37_8 TaxID=1817863 RepID=A0A1F5VTJ5_9BACT|nr:MAG: hypothetical protein A2Y62_12455 [Candidatus Fischerbacteria bacterium RBG_13_37_8]